MAVEKCENCERIIGNLEPAHLLEGRIICQHCDSLLRPEKQLIIKSSNIVQTSTPKVEVVAKRVSPEKKKSGPVCTLCGQRMVKKTISTGNATGIAGAILVLLLGILLCATLIGAIIGVPLIICALFMGGKRKRVLKCIACGAIAERA